MRIVESSVSVGAERAAQSRSETSLQIRSEPPRPPQQEDVALSDTGQARAASELGTLKSGGLDWRIELLRRLVEAMTGKSVKVADLDGLLMSASAPSQPGNSGSEGGLAVDYRQVLEEFESASFTADGVVKTADGREISFSAELLLQRSYRSETSVSMATGSLARPQKDPLVINFDGSAAQLAEQTFAFDLDADGKQDDISLLKSGSGFLALDRNGNDRVDDGRELFGPQSGNGFADLALYDDDSNGWIDEGDAVWGQLKVWLKDDAGNDRLLGLSDLNVGAIYLGHGRADFDLKDSNNRNLGQIRASGVWLSESGSGGTIQHVDLAI
ncbi:VCBS repeat-containing protein [Chitinolyticbacter meiyuanensis]|uniref:VCBS repeat-containing protein n=1 Tax=Chitinolyticbacter meiyuanensis TaxID=682798 RepID=UPI0011E5F684|nr:VCBS repeat-containing protein [Chitinolyticbacter meiyuanensis]